MKNLFKLDLRSLALFRIVIGIIAIFDFFNRIKLTPAFYSDSGIISRADLIENFEIPWKFSLLNLSGDPIFSYILAILGIIAAFGLMVGMKTRLSAFICWMLMYSFQNRFPQINHGGDNLLRLLILFSIFMPVSRFSSFDKFFGKEKIEEVEGESNIFSFSNLFLLTQIYLMYFFTFFYKWHPSWFKSLDSLYFAMNLDLYTTNFGHWLLNFPMTMKVLSFLTLWLEGLGPLLLFIPVRVGLFRMLAFVSFWLLHIGILLTLHLGNFPWACLALWIPILPPEFWERIKITALSGVKLYYDFECGFCRRFCFFLKEVFGLEGLEVLASNENREIEATIISEKSWCLERSGQKFLRFSVFIELLKLSRLKYLGNFFSLPVLSQIGDFSYRKISVQRMKIGTFLNQFLKNSSIRVERWYHKVLYCSLILLAIAWNFEGFYGPQKFDIKSPFTDVAFIFGLNQQWNMFAPKPMSDDGWVVVEGDMSDGKTWNVFENKPVDFSRPKYIQDTVDGTQWRKFFVNLWNRDNLGWRPRLAKYICRSWNSKNIYKVNHVNIYFMLERTLPEDRKDSIQTEKNLMWEYTCKE